MNSRISFLIDELGIKKAGFAKRLNLSQPFVSELCSGKSKPSDRTISDICREFDVNEEWLRTGEGEMFRQLGREEEITDFLAKLIREPDAFQARLIAAMAKLTPEQWELFETVFDSLVEAKKEKPL